MEQRQIRQFIVVPFIAAGYLLTAKLGLSLATIHPSSTAVWAPAGISLAAILIFGYRAWPGIFIGAFFANFTTAGSVITSLGIAAGNTLEALIGGYLVNRFAGGQNAFRNPYNIFKFVFFAGVFSTAVSATIGVTTLTLAHFAAWTDFGAIWLTWWLGDLAGDLMFTPLLILWSREPKILWRRSMIIERLAFLVCLFGVSYLIFGNSTVFGINHYPLSFLIMPVLLWSVLNFEQKEAAVSAFILSVFSLWWTLKGFGPFARPDLNESLLLLQVFLSAVSVTALLVSSVVLQLKRAAQDLQTRTKETEGLNQELRLIQKTMLNVLENLSMEKAVLDQAREGDQAILMSIGEGLVVVDPMGKIIFVNKVFQEFFGLTNEQCIGKKLDEVVQIHDNEQLLIQHEHPLFEAMRTGKKVKNQIFVRSGESTFQTHITAAPVMLNDRTSGAIGIIHIK